MQFLLFRIYGALASWGSTAVGERRPSDIHPSKSALTGLIAGSLGIERTEESKIEKIAQQFSFAISVLNPGTLLRDYHTSQVPGRRQKQHLFTRSAELSEADLNTILSTRDYRQDAVYTIALWSRQTTAIYSLEQIAAALKAPKFPLFLGRKSCPLSLPLSPQILDGKTLYDVMSSAQFETDVFIEPLLNKNRQIFFYWEQLSPEFAGMKPTMELTKRDLPSSRKNWQFFERREYHYSATTQGN